MPEFPHRIGGGTCRHAKDADRKLFERISGLNWETGEPLK